MSSSAKRALRILEFVSDSDHPLGVTEIARLLSLAPATVFRSLDALSRADLVSRYQASSRYVLGAAADRLCQSLIARFRIRELSLPYLRQLASVSGESTSLHVRLRKYAMKGVVLDLGDEAFISILPMLSRVWAKISFASATEIFSISTKKLRRKTPTKRRCGFIRRCTTPWADCGWITI